MNNVYVDIHVLQTVPPSCINRDDTGSPKTAVYGGTTRARISSQAWKHAIRKEFHKRFPNEELGLRTKKIAALVKTELQKLDPSLSDEKAEEKVSEGLKKAGLAAKDVSKKKDVSKERELSNEMAALFFISMEQVRAIAALIHSDKKEKKMYEIALKKAPAIDMIMFGRMVASDPSLNYDTTVQVAHSISTHTVHNEFDYFTAIDDCSQDDESGASHLGTVEFNSSSMYRFATINVSELAFFVGAETGRAVSEFLESFIYSMPTGKENSFANRTLPFAIYITVRNDQPINLCGAFERPIKAGQDGYEEASEKAFVEYAKELYTKYGNAPAYSFGMGNQISSLTETASVPVILNKLENVINEQVGPEK